MVLYEIRSNFLELRKAIKGIETLIILDRSLSVGGPGGPVCSEIRSALYNEKDKPSIVNFVGGLGGRDITVSGFKEIVNRGMEIARMGSKNEYEIFDVRQ